MKTLVLSLLLPIAALSQSLSLYPSFWSLQHYSYYAPVQSSVGSIYFDFPVSVDAPVSGSDWINYLRYALNGDIGNARQLKLTFDVETSGTPVFGFHSEEGNTCNTPASVRFYIERRGWKKHINDGDYRWWSNPVSFQLQSAQSAVLTVPLTGDQWSNVWGQFGNTRTREFGAALRQVENIGLSYGGGCFFGHGVNVSGGTARFVLRAYEIQP